MDIKQRYITDDLCLCHFCIKPAEVRLMLRDLNQIPTSNESINECIKNAIHDFFLDSALVDKGIISIGEKKINYLVEYDGVHPIIGVATFMTLRDGINISLPMTITKDCYDNINKALKEKDEFFNSCLIDLDMFYEKPATIVSDFSTVEYEMKYTQNGKVLNTISHMYFDMIHDDDLNPELFKGSKVGDTILLDDSDISIEATIVNITDTIPYDETNYNESMLSDFPYINFKDMKNRFYSSYDRLIKRDCYVDFIVNFALDRTDLNVSKEVYDFYKEKDFFNYINEYNDSHNEKEQKKAIEKSIMFDLLCKMIDLKSNKCLVTSDEALQAQDDLMNYYFENDCDTFELANEIDKIKLLKYCKLENITKGIDL